ncbi:MAG: hypothetical protein IAF38_17435, partial [Bacteroidia bacterium]|nr:hypothetical protein [Bacteroidia bacterium]
MKSILSRINTCTFFCILVISAFSNQEHSGILMSYSVSKNAKDVSLSKTEAVFEFRFTDTHLNKLIVSPIKMSYNGINLTATKDEHGKFSLKIKPGKYQFKFYYDKKHFEITTDSISISPAFRTCLDVYFQSSEFPVICNKPV